MQSQSLLVVGMLPKMHISKLTSQWASELINVNTRHAEMHASQQGFGPVWEADLQQVYF